MLGSVTARGNARSTARNAVIAAASVALTITAAPNASAATNDQGLFGAQDPTYDGVYRQSLAVTGLVAADRRVPRSSVQWLLRQQCDNGSFQSYRSNTDVPCGKSDPVNYSGPDSNSTALAAAALLAVGRKQEANAAVRALRKYQNSDGGFAYYKGNASDANSTGLSLTALNGHSLGGHKFNVGEHRAGKKAASFLKTLQLKCSAAKAERGLLSYTSDPLVANDLATAQAALGLVTTLPPVPNPQARKRPKLRCASGKPVQPINVRDSALDGLVKRLKGNNGLLPDAFGGGSDPSATAQAAIALSTAERAGGLVAKAEKRLKGVAIPYTGAGVSPQAGALGTLLLFSATTGGDPKHFGGVNLAKTLLATRR